ncbi:MAG TPA: alpha/beta hydrolase family protein [Candidatus Aquicultor sp.]|jgi:dienelactone hydrolase
MNKIIAHTLDKVSMPSVSPRRAGLNGFDNLGLDFIEKLPHPPKRVLKTPKIFLKHTAAQGPLDVFQFAFPSKITTASTTNNTVFGHYFKHKNGLPKSTIIILHGLFERRYKRAEAHALNLTKQGHDCVLITLPYHMERSVKRSASGKQFVSGNPRDVFEALQQAVKDVLALITWLTGNGEQKIGLLGFNLGAYVAGLVATAVRKVNYAILLAPVTSPLQLFKGSVAETRADTKTGVIAAGLEKESDRHAAHLLAQWELQYNKPLVPAERIFLAEARHDSFIPCESIERLWDAWGKPRIQRYQCGHIGAIGARRTNKDISKFLNEALSQQRNAGLLT